MEFEFSADVWFWKGPAPWYFVSVPEPERSAIAEVSSAVTYGWGMIPVTLRIGRTKWTTSLWPKDGGYIVPLKADVRKRERIELGQTVTVWMRVDV